VVVVVVVVGDKGLSSICRTLVRSDCGPLER
jgi:hypothetical protein